MEIERKYLVKEIPVNLDQYESKKIAQGYLCTEPVVRIRRSNNDYYMTYKGDGLMVREEYNLPLTEEAYTHLRPKIDGLLISKTRYLIPLDDKLTAELDIFEEDLKGLVIVEVEFDSVEEANAFTSQPARSCVDYHKGVTIIFHFHPISFYSQCLYSNAACLQIHTAVLCGWYT